MDKKDKLVCRSFPAHESFPTGVLKTGDM